MKNIFRYFTVAALLCCSALAGAQSKHDIQKLEKYGEDMILYQRMSDVAYVDKVRITGPSKTRIKPTGCEFLDTLADNNIKFYAYIFFPKEVKQNRKYPLLVFSHGGIHGTFSSVYVHVLREMTAQGYIVVAPDYRGSTGYGKEFYESIDYGGVENEDVLAARDYMVENYSVVDPSRIGLIGWSHGGMISLMNILQWPEKYTCAYAGVPVSDVTYRLSYQKENYKDNFSPDYHVGCLPEDNPLEYARRSPVSYADRLERPLMITTCANDDDVCVKEVERMIRALQQAGKKFEYEIYPAMPGAHVFERIDSKEASDIRFKTYQFLARYLKPAHPFKSISDLRKAGYMYY